MGRAASRVLWPASCRGYKRYIARERCGYPKATGLALRGRRLLLAGSRLQRLPYSLANASSALSICSGSRAAETWTRSRAWPWGTTG